MPEREQSHAARRRRRPRRQRRRRNQRSRLRWLPEVAILLVVVLAMVEVRFGYADRWFGLGADPVTDPAGVAPPAGLELAEAAPAPPVAEPVASGRPDAAAVAAAVTSYLRHPSLGKHRAAAVADLRTGEVVLRRGARRFTPASTLKLLTGAAALSALGPDTTFATTTKLAGNRLFLVGGGDPYLMPDHRSTRGEYPRRTDLTTLAARTAQRLAEQQVRRVRLAYDDSLFTGPAVNPAWPDSYLPDNVVPPISALWSDQGHAPSWGFVDDPTAEAARVFADALRRQGVTVVGEPARAVAPGTARDLAEVRSATVAAIVQHTIAVSDNQAAEVLLRHVGREVVGEGSFRGGVRGLRQVLSGLDVPIEGLTLYDGSGLSRRNLVTADALLTTLRRAASTQHPELRPVITGLPVAGYTGSLARRFSEAPLQARGMVRAKTGTLTGVHGLAGVVTDASGAEMAFVALADRVPEMQQLTARTTIDRLAAALGACACGSGAAAPAG